MCNINFNSWKCARQFKFKSRSALLFLFLVSLLSIFGIAHGLKCHACIFAEQAPSWGRLSTTDCLDPSRHRDTLPLMDCNKLPAHKDREDPSLHPDFEWGACQKGTYYTQKYGQFLVRGCFDFTPYYAKDVVGKCVLTYPDGDIADPFLHRNFTGDIIEFIIQHMLLTKWSPTESNLPPVPFLTGRRCACDVDGCNSESGLTPLVPSRSISSKAPHPFQTGSFIHITILSLSILYLGYPTPTPTPGSGSL